MKPLTNDITAPFKAEEFTRKMAEKGVCCSCGYYGEEETECTHYPDKVHCVHWWDGPDEERKADGDN